MKKRVTAVNLILSNRDTAHCSVAVFRDDIMNVYSGSDRYGNIRTLHRTIQGQKLQNLLLAILTV